MAELLSFCDPWTTSCFCVADNCLIISVIVNHLVRNHVLGNPSLAPPPPSCVPRTHRAHRPPHCRAPCRPHYRRSRTSRHMRPLWYGHFQKPARSSVVFGVPSERRLQYHSPSGQMMWWRMKDHLASVDSSQYDPPVFWYWLMQPTTVSAWTHQWRPESRRLVLLDRPGLPWRT